MKKVFKVFITVFLLSSLVASHSFAEGENQVNPFEKLKSEVHTLNGEKFEVITWKDKNGVISYTVPTEVSNKADVANYVTQLVDNKAITPRGLVNDWSRDVNAYDTKDARVTIKTSGYSDKAAFKPVTADLLRVNKGTQTAAWLGSGTPQKIVSSYEYEFTGVKLAITVPTILEVWKDTVKYQSLPVEKTSIHVLTTEYAYAETHLGMIDNVKVKAIADIYVGSRTYRPQVETKVMFLEKS